MRPLIIRKRKCSSYQVKLPFMTDRLRVKPPRFAGGDAVTQLTLTGPQVTAPPSATDARSAEPESSPPLVMSPKPVNKVAAAPTMLSVLVGDGDTFNVGSGAG